MLKKGIFVSGTDTGVGKTVVSGILLSALKQAGRPCGYFKPFQTGYDLDTETVAELVGLGLDQFPKPTYYFSQPTAPLRAADAEGKTVEIEKVLSQWKALEPRSWVVEGAGGLLVPLSSKQTIRDLIVELKMKLLLVASTRVGTINHTLLSVEAARNAGIELAGIVLVGERDIGLDSFLERMSNTPILAQVPLLSSLAARKVAEVAHEYFPINLLEKLYGPCNV